MAPKSKNSSTPPHVAELLARLRSTSKDERDAAVAGLCAEFEPLVRSMANRYQQPVVGGEREELQQVARLGVIEACGTFDEKRGAFSAHVVWHLRDVLGKYVSGLGLRTTSLVATRYRSKLRRMSVKLAHDLMREPTIEELAVAVGQPAETIEKLLIQDEGSTPLDAPRGRGDQGSIQYEEPWVESYAAPELTPEEELIAQEEVDELKEVMRRREENRR